MDALGPEDPRSAGPYRLIARLGAGGMGRVFLGRSQRGRTVAVKLVHPELMREPATRRRFRHEVEAARKVGGEWTAAVLDADTESDAPWVATAYVPGPGLKDVVESHGPLPEPSVLALAAGLARALNGVHGNDLIHRDVKPSNVLITIDGPRLIDFGIARSAEVGLGTRSGGIIGSPGFMSPEQVRGRPLTPASDVFSLGAVLAFAATGRPPFGDGGVHARMFRIASEPADLGGLDGPVRDLVERCLAKDPAARPALDDLLVGPLADPPGGAWLPAEVTAELGRHAAQLLEVEEPREPSPVPGAPAALPAATSPGPAPGDTRGGLPGRRKMPFYLGAGAAATVVVLVSGLPFALLRDQDAGARDGGGAAASGTARDVPLGMLGTWEGRSEAFDGPSARLQRITIRRGTVGEQVADLHTATADALCEYEGVLKEGGSTIRLNTQLVRSFRSRCADRVEVVLTLEAGKVRWKGPGPVQMLFGARNQAVPQRLQGVWQWAGGAQAPSPRQVELGSDDVGSEAVTVVAPGRDGAQCIAKAILVSAEKDIVLFPSRLIAGQCELDGLQKIAPQGDGAAYWASFARGESGNLRQYVG
ncbi:serine/threonine-protein kinase [Actinomadura chokoriensis]|uniref:Serine/threonine-protein kinase n=1 Tax=Actinomadura chokoriensis TaxID=454156 RepID=A0ABV4QWC0_9ACTN